MSAEKSLVPQTHDEIIKFFDSYEDKFLGSCLRGIYECRIGIGDSVKLAYLNALRAGVGMEAMSKEEFEKGMTAEEILQREG